MMAMTTTNIPLIFQTYHHSRLCLEKSFAKESKAQGYTGQFTECPTWLPGLSLTEVTLGTATVSLV